ncbi:MAG: glycoside hydrolase family 15 protein [Candidatus Dormibacterales bacterium]
MPRSLVIGNGSCLVGYDAAYDLRDIFFPRVGQWNHTLGNPCRTGFWVDGRFSWVSDPGWSRRLGYAGRTLVTDVQLESAALGISVHFADFVDMRRNYLIRDVSVTAARDAARVRIFFHHDWYFFESDLGGTVLYDPRHRALIAYKDDCYFLLGGRVGSGRGITSWAAGKKGEGAQGTWVDAEDGELSRHPIEQGSVDSTIGFDVGGVLAGRTVKLLHWVCMGRSLKEVCHFGQDVILARGEETYRGRTAAYWSRWCGKDARDVGGALSPEVDELYRRSQLVARLHCDGGGGVVAATDYDITKFARDTYAYVWPRDGALCAAALDGAGLVEVTRRFFLFCRRLLSEEGFFLHKYGPDGHPGSSWHPWVDEGGHRVLPIQEDETGLVLWALWQHFRRHQDLDFASELYTSLVLPAADWMAGYVDPDTGLPCPSWDLWEERWGVHAFTVGAVWGGLDAARRFAELFGDETAASRYEAAAAALREAADRFLHRPELGRFARRLTLDGGGAVTPDPVLDSALHGLTRFGMYPADDPRMAATMAATQGRLWLRTEEGGMARYEDDPYFRVEPDAETAPGNPWFICTFWLAQWQIACARSAGDLAAPRALLDWVVAHQLPGGLLSEQVHPHTGAPLSVSPLAWSHAELIVTVDDYLGKLQELGQGGSD